MSNIPTVPYSSSPTPDPPETPRDLQVHSPIRGSPMADEKFLLSPLPLSAREEGFSKPPMPVRKYSGVWWESWWNRAVVVGLIPRIIYGSVALACVILWVGLTVFFTREDTDWQTKQIHKFENSKQEQNFALQGLIKSFDTVSRTLNVEWSGLWKDYENPNMTFVPLANGTYPNTRWPVEIYRDTATTVWVWNETYSQDYLYYKISNSSAPAIAVIGTTPDDSFDTQISFKGASDTNDIRKQPLFAYPFDEWKGSIAFSTNDLWIDKALGMNKSFVFAPGGALLKEHALNWRFELNDTMDCGWPPNINDVIIAQNAMWSPEPFDMSLLTNGTFADFTIPCQLRIEIIGKRPPLVKFAAVLSLVVNWTSTFFIFVLTCEVLIMRRGFMLSGTDLLGVTFTSLFALPSVRLLLPGAPDFGALIDLVGIIPNVIAISLCITAIAIAKLNRRKKDEKIL